jgi:hypothetical protein
MAQPTYVLDGTMAYGSETLTINSVAYIVNNLKCEGSATEASDETATGAPNRMRITKGRYTITAQLQLAASNTVYPTLGQTFPYTPPNESSALTFAIKIPPAFEEENQASAIRVLNISAISGAAWTTS